MHVLLQNHVHLEYQERCWQRRSRTNSHQVLSLSHLLALFLFFSFYFNSLCSRCYMFTSKYLKNSRINKRLIVQLLQDFMTISDAQVLTSLYPSLLCPLLFLCPSCLPRHQFTKHLGIFYNLLVQLMMDDSKKIRKALKPIWVRIGVLMGGKKMNSLLPPLPVR